MEAGSNEFCCGCLSGGRKMKSVNDFWSGQAFLQLLFEIQIFVTDDHTSWLCWECEARITNFAAFRNQVKNCSNTLLKYIQKDDQSTPKTVSRLNTYTLPVIDLNPDAPISYTGETYILTLVNKEINKINTKLHIKDEQDECNTNADKEQNNDELMIEKQIKNEVDAYSDDDRSLIDIRNDCKTIKDQLNVRKKVKNKNGKVKLKKRTKLYDEIELTPEEVVKERSNMKEREEYINSMFRCEKCIVPFPNTDDLNDHVRSKHELHGTKHMCGVCSRTFLSAGSLSAHVRCHTSRRRCVLCAHTTTSDRKAMAHYTEKHQDSEMYDLSTQVYQSLKSQDDTEMNGSKSTAQFPCEYCDKTFSWKTSLRKHMETHIIEAGHKRKPFCETCRLSFTTSANLRKHMTTSSKHQINSKLTKLKEDIPGSTSALIQREKDIESIASTINSQKEQFACSQCEKRFQWKGNLLRHLKSHAAKANGELVCEPCNRTFSSIATYKQHMQISRKHVSENEFKYVCSDCGKRFSNKSKLSDHINWDHLKKFTHRCSDCQKAFKSHTSLYLHRQVVHKHYNSEHLCDHCGKSFPNKTKLRSHIVALHTLETPYKCDACPARFGWHSCLSRHMRQVHKNMHRKSAVNS